MAGSSSDRPILEVLPNNSKRIFSGDFTGIAQRGSGCFLTTSAKACALHAAPLCLPSHSVWTPKSRRGKWVQLLCSSNRLDEH